MHLFPSQGGRHRRTRRCGRIRTYFDLLDAADDLRVWLRSQLAMFGLNLLGLRVLEMLYREGPMEMIGHRGEARVSDATYACAYVRMEAKGWVSRKNREARSGGG